MTSAVAIALAPASDMLLAATRAFMMALYKGRAGVKRCIGQPARSSVVRQRHCASVSLKYVAPASAIPFPAKQNWIQDQSGGAELLNDTDLPLSNRLATVQLTPEIHGTQAATLRQRRTQILCALGADVVTCNACVCLCSSKTVGPTHTHWILLTTS